MRVGIVGTGMIAHELVPHFAELGLEVGAVSGTRLERAQELTDKVGGTPFGSTEEMLAQADVEAVYVAVPNHLHYAIARQALLADRHVIMEKPFASTYAEAAELADLARDRGLLLYEAITTIHQPNFRKIRELLAEGRIGDVKLVSVNYSQYSRRYDAFRRGEVLPAFDPSKSGGALMDLGLYNLQYLVGLFGEPKGVSYLANMERGIDTSGVCTLDFGSFKAVSVAAKDCAAPGTSVIEGTEGYLLQHTSPNLCGPVTLHLNDGTKETFDLNPEWNWEAELRDIVRGLEERDTEGCYRLLEHSLRVSRVQTQARRSAGIRFPADERE